MKIIHALLYKYYIAHRHTNNGSMYTQAVPYKPQIQNGRFTRGTHNLSIKKKEFENDSPHESVYLISFSKEVCPYMKRFFFYSMLVAESSIKLFLNVYKTFCTLHCIS